MRALTAKHRTVFDVSAHRNGRPLLQAKNFLDVAARLSAAGLGAPAEVRAALVGGLLPGVITVPAMVVALAQLQERGLTYEKIG